jgi:hypothetical protein
MKIKEHNPNKRKYGKLGNNSVGPLRDDIVIVFLLAL